MLVGAVVELGGHPWFYGLGALQGPALSAVMAAALVALALAWLAPEAPGGAERPVPAWCWRVLAFLPAVLLGDAVWANPVARELAWGWQPRVALIAGLVLVVAPAALRAPRIWVAAAALAAGLALRAVLIAHSTVEHTGDMLMLVTSAAQRLLDGQSPYTTYRMPWPLPLTYLPVTWLAYVPTQALGLDPRWVNLAAELVVLAVVARAIRGRDDPRWLLVAAWYLLPSVVDWARFTTALVSWAALTLMIATAARGHRLAPVAAGLALAATPLAVVLAPLVALAFWRARGWRAACAGGALALALAAALIAPFAAWAPRAFFEGTVSWFNDLDGFPRGKWQATQAWGESTGFAGLFWQRGLEHWLKPLQAFAVALVIGCYLRRGCAPAALPAHAVAAFLLFMVANPVIFPYYYAPAAAIALVAAGAPDHRVSSFRTQRPAGQ